MSRDGRIQLLARAAARGEVTMRDALEVGLFLVEAIVENTEATLRLCDKLAERDAAPHVDRAEPRKHVE